MYLTNEGIKGNNKLITIEEAGCAKRSILVVEKTRGMRKHVLTESDVRMFSAAYSCADLVIGEVEPGRAVIFKDRIRPETDRKYNLRNLLAKLVWTDTRASAKYRPYLNILVVLDYV